MPSDSKGNHCRGTWRRVGHPLPRIPQPRAVLVPGLTTRQQPLWDQHAAFIDRLYDDGRIVMAGPYADCTRALLIVKARDSKEAVAMFRDDPWTKGGILVDSEVIEWTVFLDSRRSDG